MDTPPVPNDMWVCGSCNTGNLIETAPHVCPICSHPRDYQVGCCTNPGESTRNTGLLQDQHESRHVGCEEPIDAFSVPSALSSSTYGYSSVAACDTHTDGFSDAEIYTRFEPGSLSYTTQDPLQQHAMPPEVNTLGGAGSQGDGVWICAECGEPNASFCWPQCSYCEHIHPE